MNKTLFQLWENTKLGRDFWDNKKVDTNLGEEAMQVISRGLEIRPDRKDGSTFWDDFLSVLGNNAEGASKLLGVRRDEVSSWSSRIREGLKKANDEKVKDGSDMIQTGG